MRKRHASSLRILRDIIGLNQQTFAQAVGSTKAIIENVEMGRTPLSEELRERIVAFTGVLPNSLSEDVPLAAAGIYDQRTWQVWSHAYFDPEHVEKIIQHCCEQLRAVISASFQTPTGNQTPNVMRTTVLEFSRWIMSKVDQHNLGWIIESNTLADERLTSRTAGQISMKTLRLYFLHHQGQSLDEWQKFDDPTLPDDEKVTYSVISFPLFAPPVWYKQHENGLLDLSHGRRQRRYILTLTAREKTRRISMDNLFRGDEQISDPDFIPDAGLSRFNDLVENQKITGGPDYKLIRATAPSSTPFAVVELSTTARRRKATRKRRKLSPQNAETAAAAMEKDRHWSKREVKALAVVTAQDKSPSKLSPPSASPKRGSARKGSASRPGAPSRKR